MRELEKKFCNKCKNEKEYEDFYKDKTKKDGYATVCKDCQKARKSQLNNAVPNDVNSKYCTRCGLEKTLDEFSKDKTNKYGVRSHCKSCIAEYNKLDKTKEIYRRNAKRYYDTEEGRVKARKRKETGKSREASRRYRQTEHGKTKKREEQQKRRATKENLLSNLTSNQYEMILEYFNYSCCYCGKHQSDIDAKLHQEHIIPVSKKGAYTASNIVPACNDCNLSKGRKGFEEWYLSQFFFDEKRYLKLKEHIKKWSTKSA